MHPMEYALGFVVLMAKTLGVFMGIISPLSLEFLASPIVSQSLPNVRTF